MSRCFRAGPDQIIEVSPLCTLSGLAVLGGLGALLLWSLADCCTGLLPPSGKHRAGLELLTPLPPLPPLQSTDELGVAVLPADVLFGFDSSEVRCEADLLSLASTLKARKLSRLLVVGHADRLGTQVHNRRLSTERAAVVADFLRRHEVSAAEFSQRGRGSDEPLTGALDCPGDRLTRPQLIACLAPDRRVEVIFKDQ